MWFLGFLGFGPRFLQKESLSEYGSGWEWDDYNTYVHAFDQATTDGVPYRYDKDGTGDVNNLQYYICPEDIETTDGQVLFSGDVYMNQKSCKAMTGNAGNNYSWPAATAGGYNEIIFNEPNSVCPRGWQLTANIATNPKSLYYIIRTAYAIQNNNDSKFRLLPLSFVRSGRYEQGLLNGRATLGFYWSLEASNSTTAAGLRFDKNYLYIQTNNYYNKTYGASVRCVSR